jgi:hypothetical protein
MSLCFAFLIFNRLSAVLSTITLVKVEALAKEDEPDSIFFSFNYEPPVRRSLGEGGWTVNFEPWTVNRAIFMPIFKNLTPSQQKIITLSLCVIGISAVAYGMIKKDNPIFLIGIAFVIAGYLLIRKKLKESIQKRSWFLRESPPVILWTRHLKFWCFSHLPFPNLIALFYNIEHWTTEEYVKFFHQLAMDYIKNWKRNTY